MNNIPLNEVINDEEVVSTINKISKSIYEYFKVTKGNFNMLESHYKLLNNKLKKIEEINNIMSISFANNNNLDQFIDDMRILFQNLKSLRKQYLNKISNYIKYKNNNNKKTFNNNNNFNNYNDNNIVKNKYNKIMNLILSLDNYSELINLVSEEKKEKFRGILSLIINELKNNDIEVKENNNNNKINISLNKEINKLKNKLSEEQKKRKELEAQNGELFEMNKINENELYDKDAKINYLNEEIKSMDLKLSEIMKEDEKNKNIINGLKRENMLINNNKNSFNEKNNLINKELESKNEEIKNYEEKIKKKEENYKLIELNYNNSRKKIDDLEQKINQGEKIMNDLKNKNSNYEKIIKEKENRIKEFETENNIIQIKNIEQMNQIEQLKFENKKTIEEKENNIEKQIEDYNLKMKELQEKIEQNEKIEIENKRTIEERDKKIDIYINEKNKLEKQIKEMEIIIKEEKEKNIKIEEQNKKNIEKLKIQISQIDSFAETINKKDELIETLRKKEIESELEKIEEYKNEIKILEEKNKKLMEDNKGLKQSNMFLINSTSPDMLKISQSINKYMIKNSTNVENFDENTIKDFLDSNFLFEEENNKLKTENENLNKKLEELKTEKENINKILEEIKRQQNNVNKENIVKNKVLSQSVNSNDSEEEEYDANYLANNAKKKNNSEDLKIDFPGLNDINEKYEELKIKIKEIKEIFNDILSKIDLELNPDMKLKINKVCELLEINP